MTMQFNTTFCNLHWAFKEQENNETLYYFS